MCGTLRGDYSNTDGAVPPGSCDRTGGGFCSAVRPPEKLLYEAVTDLTCVAISVTLLSGN